VMLIMATDPVAGVNRTVTERELAVLAAQNGRP
jgi:hypothetical protein